MNMRIPAITPAIFTVLSTCFSGSMASESCVDAPEHTHVYANEHTHIKKALSVGDAESSITEIITCHNTPNKHTHTSCLCTNIHQSAGRENNAVSPNVEKCRQLHPLTQSQEQVEQTMQGGERNMQTTETCDEASLQQEGRSFVQK